MRPSVAAFTARDRKLQSIIDFAADLHAKLPSLRDTEALDLLFADIGHHVHTCESLLQKNTGVMISSLAKDLERNGRNIWNLCVRLRREPCEGSAPPGLTRLLTHTRLFGFQCIVLAREGGRSSKGANGAETAYMMGLALNVSRLCLEDSGIESARWALQKAADYTEYLKNSTPASSSVPTGATYPELEAQYLTLRITLAWKENRLDVAEHMFTKLGDLPQMLSISSAEDMVDVLHQIGIDLSSTGDGTSAIKWLRRAHHLLCTQEIENLSVKGLDLRLALIHTLIRALLQYGTAEHIQEASDLVALVESGIGDKPVVLHWQLEILKKSPSELFDTEAYASIIRRMIRTFDFSDSSLQFIQRHIRELAASTPKLAGALLSEFILQQVVPSERTEWINRTIVRRVWMATIDTETNDATSHLSTLLDAVYQAMAKPMSPDAAGAAHSLIWKALDGVFSRKAYRISEAWAQIALHPSFASCGASNSAKFGRRLILCALGLNEPNKAIDVFRAMPSAAQNETLTRYLMFKVSLQSWDPELGRECIESLSNSDNPQDHHDVLYACIREAQQAGDKVCTLAALKAIVDGWDPLQKPTCNLPSLLRCTIRLIHVTEEQEGSKTASTPKQDFVEDICVRFKQAARYATQDLRDEEQSTMFTVPELNWFRKNAYNIGASNCHAWELSHLVRIFNACIQISQCYPKDIPLAERGEHELMSMRCHFVTAAALVSLARTEDATEAKLQLYVELRQHVSEFDALYSGDAQMHGDEVEVDLLAKLSALFVFDFEAAVHLMSWDELAHIIRKAHLCKDEDMYKAMGDCILRSRCPGKVNAFKVKNPFPSAELEWLVATAFNHAIDFYARGDENPCHRWALRSMDLAEYMDDGGMLRSILQERFAKLRFEGPARSC